MKKLYKEILEEVSFSKEELKEIQKKADDLIRKISSAKVHAQIGGSLAKGTLLKKDKIDVDIFVKFQNERETKKLESILKKQKLKFKIVHGSRDYAQIKDGKIIFEIIPVVSVKKPEQANNVTDVSLMHVKYVVGKIKRKKKLVDEIKLAKIFCSASGCYGAESYIGGFSGYSLEILVSHFGSFEKFLREMIKIETPSNLLFKKLTKVALRKKGIDPKKYFKSEKEITRELNQSKLNSPIILIDPTYKYRNVCAGLTQETFKEFLVIAKKFLKKPSKKYFIKRKFDVEAFRISAKTKNAKFFEFNFSTNKQEGDIAATKMKKVFNFILAELKRKNQEILDKKFIYLGGKSAKGYLIVKENKEMILKGPQNWDEVGIKNFKKAHKKVFEKKKRFYVKKKISLSEILINVVDIAHEMGVSVSF